MNDEQERREPRRVGQVWVRRESDEAAIWDPDTQTLHRLNPSALAIWELCDGDTTEEEIVGAVVEVTDASLSQATEDVRSTLATLRAAGLVE